MWTSGRLYKIKGNIQMQTQKNLDIPPYTDLTLLGRKLHTLYRKVINILSRYILSN